DGEPFSYGRCEAPPRNTPTFTQGPGLPFAGVPNFGVDTTGFVEVGVGGNVVIPPIENRQFAGAVLTVSVYNEEAPDSNSAFERPAYYAVVPSTGDMSALAMIPTSPDVTIPGDARVMFRLFLARSIREGGSIER